VMHLQAVQLAVHHAVQAPVMQDQLIQVSPRFLQQGFEVDCDIGVGGQANGGSINKSQSGLVNLDMLNLGSGNAGNGGDASSGNALGGDSGCKL